MTLIVVALAMVLLLLAPAHATRAAPVRGSSAITNGHAPVASVVMAHSNHQGGAHDHSHEIVGQIIAPTTTSTSQGMRPVLVSSIGSALDLIHTMEHPPKP